MGFHEKGLGLPTFLEAGPRAELRFDPTSVKSAILTAGGVAPGLNSVVHSIVKRHTHTYKGRQTQDSGVFGIFDSFKGLSRSPIDMKSLRPEETEEWLERGGSELGNLRTNKDHDKLSVLVQRCAENLRHRGVKILYVIGGDGSQKIAHEIATYGADPDLCVVGIPKTMDNDLVWVWQSFGFNTAVERATDVINTLNSEASSTRRVCVIELFGAEAGFVAANAALASGHADLVLIPEVFTGLTSAQCEDYLRQCVRHLESAVKPEGRPPHAIVIIAEGVSRVLAQNSVTFDGLRIEGSSFTEQFRKHLSERLTNLMGDRLEVFSNSPRHNIRAGKANSHDQIYCERLGALAVDNALAGYSDFMISQWLTEFVLVPLELVIDRRKRIPITGMFWKQVCASTGQPTTIAAA